MNLTALFASPPLIEDPPSHSTAVDHVALVALVRAAIQPVLDEGDADEAAATRTLLAELLASAVGRNMEDVGTEQFAELTALLPRLAAVARSIPVDVLGTFSGKPRDVLELLDQQPDEGLLQGDVERATGIPTDYLSKVVRRLADADLILRWAEGRHRRLVITGAGQSALARERRASRAAAVAALAPPLGEVASPVFPLFETRNTFASKRIQAHGFGARPASQWSSRSDAA
ncbi:MAG: hypothetical protein JWM89_1302 [Acidimicrobiales bacterium]|nr:hypothetical protein [Acidimicrobiales bacterium]